MISAISTSTRRCLSERSVSRGVLALGVWVVSAVVLALPAPRVPAQEIDFELESEAGATTIEDTKLRTETTATTTLSWILSPDQDIEVSGSYGYRYDELTTDDGGELVPGLDRARFMGRYPLSTSRGGVFEIAAGRYGFADTTEQVVDTPADGLSLGLIGPTTTVRLQAGYTGLLLRESTAVRVTAADAADEENHLGPAHLLGRLEVAFPEVLSRQSIVLDVTGHLDTPELATSDFDGREDAARGLYSSLTLTGPLSRRVFYTLYGIGRAGEYYADKDLDEATYSLLAVAAGGSLRGYSRRLAKSRGELSVFYAGGEDGFRRFSPGQDGTTASFAPITPSEPVRLAPLTPSNLLTARAAYSVQPIDLGAGPREGLRTEVSVAAAYRPFSGSGTIVGLAADTESGYVGTEIGTTVEIRPFSDLIFRLEGDTFFPTDLVRNGGVVAEADPQTRFSAAAELSF